MDYILFRARLKNNNNKVCTRFLSAGTTFRLYTIQPLEDFVCKNIFKEKRFQITLNLVTLYWLKIENGQSRGNRLRLGGEEGWRGG